MKLMFFCSYLNAGGMVDSSSEEYTEDARDWRLSLTETIDGR
jgi:hypothetical protein